MLAYPPALHIQKNIFHGLLWSDPREDKLVDKEKGYQKSGRGCGVEFGSKVTQAFLRANNLWEVIRSHEGKLLLGFSLIIFLSWSAAACIFGDNSHTCSLCLRKCM